MAKQHATGIDLLHEFYSGKLEGCFVGSNHIRFEPGKGTLKPDFVGDIQSAGSTALLVQIMLPCCIFSKSNAKLQFIGGTNAAMAPQIDYLQLIFAPMVKHLLDIDVSFQTINRGFFPIGKGMIKVSVEPKESLKSFTLVERGSPLSIDGIGLAVGKRYSSTKSELIVKSAIEELQKWFGTELPINIESIYDPKSPSSGICCVLRLRTSTECLLGGDSLGESKQSDPESVGRAAAQELIRAWKEGGCVDSYLQDQLLIYMALAGGRSELLCGPITLHTRTAIHVAESLTNAKFTIQPVPNGASEEKEEQYERNIIICEGIGHVSS